MAAYQKIIYVVPRVSARVNYNKISSLDPDEWLYSRPMPGGVHPLVALLGRPHDGHHHYTHDQHGTEPTKLCPRIPLHLDRIRMEMRVPECGVYPEVLADSEL
jgi:hypothetical protein